VTFCFSARKAPSVIKRTIEISQESLHVAVELDQLRLYRHEPESGLVSSIPCEDIGLVVVDHPAVTFSHAALARLVDFGAAVLICGKNHLPAGMLSALVESHGNCLAPEGSDCRQQTAAEAAVEANHHSQDPESGQEFSRQRCCPPAA
jgi:hypothetical protein